MPTTTHAAPAAPSTTHQPKGFRPDVEGLRAIAVGTVLWFHAGLSGLTGGFAGVDIFFVISGFLITGQITREVERTGRISLVGFYARRAKRLFPAAATVLVTTTLLTWIVLPKISWRDFGWDITSAAAYVVNWRLAARSVDYLAEDTTASPVQHFWSLAVEEQFYIIWPILLLLLALLIRTRRLPIRPTLAIGLAAIVIPTLAWSIHLTATDPARAYFVTTTRLWELGVGALVAVGTTVWARLRPPIAAAIAWGGLAVIAVGLFTQSTRTPWPGSAALIPVLGAAAVILGGQSAGALGPVRLLGVRPMVWIGGLSYSLYLWHWPLVVAAKQAWHGLTWWQGVAVVTASVIPAWLTHKLIENPLRFHPWVVARSRNALVLGLICSLVGAACGAALAFAGRSSGFTTIDEASAPAGTFGAQILGNGAEPAKVTIDMHPEAMTPDPLMATADAPTLYADDCQTEQTTTDVFTCTYGAKASSKVIALVGDSKSAQWFPALEKFATTHGWTITTYLKSSCPWSSALIYGGQDPSHRYTICKQWGAKVLDRLTGPEKPTVIVTSGIRGTAFTPSGTEDRATMVAGYADYWSAMGTIGVPVIVLNDTPQPGKVVYECVLDHPADFMTACKGRFNDGSGGAALRAAVTDVPTARLIDMNPWICPQKQCWPVIGNVLVWRQGSHITATYAASLSAVIDRKLAAALHELGVATS